MFTKFLKIVFVLGIIASLLMSSNFVYGITEEEIKEMTSKEEFPLISTPWNNPESWKGTWQMTTYKIGKLWPLAVLITPPAVGPFVGVKMRNKINEDIKAQQDKILKKTREKYPIINLMYEKWLHKVEEYEELANIAEDARDIEIILEHIEKQTKKLKEAGKKVNPAFETLKRRLEHIKAFLEENQEEITTISRNTVVALVLTILLKYGWVLIL